MRKYVYPKDILPEMGYDVPRKRKCCGNCRHSKVTNAGAIRPGLECTIMNRIATKLGYNVYRKTPDFNGQVNYDFGSCDFHNVSQQDILLKVKGISPKQKGHFS